MKYLLGLASLAIPWLNPFTIGPSAAMVPWILSLICVNYMAVGVTRSTTKLSFSPTIKWMVFAGTIYSCLRSIWSGVDIQTFATLVAFTATALMTCVGVWLTTDSRREQMVAKILLSVAVISCAIATLQYLSLEHWLGLWVSQSDGGAAYSNLRQRNQFATLCGIGFLSLLLICSPPTNRAAALSSFHIGIVFNKTARFWPWFALTLLAIGNGLSSSRTGAVQWLLIIAAVACWRSSLRADVRHLAYEGLAIYALVVATMPWFAQWVGNSNTGLLGRAQEMDTISGGRMTLYSNVIDLIAMKPWFGWGWRELAYAHYSTHFDVRFMELLDNAHNLPLHLAVELGVPFALAFCGVIVWAIVRSAPWRETDPTRQLAWGILMLIGVHSMVEYPLWYGPFLMTLGMCIGLLQRPKKEGNSAVVHVFINNKAIKIIAIALLCLTAYLAFDYHRVSQIYLSEEDRSALYRDDVMGAAKRSVVFSKHAQFAELVTTPVTAQTAPHVLELALKLIHFSPEPRVIEPLIESATMLHFDDIAMFHLARYKAMYPKDYAAWSALKK